MNTTITSFLKRVKTAIPLAGAGLLMSTKVFAQEVGTGVSGLRSQLQTAGEGYGSAERSLPVIIGNFISVALGLLGIIMVVLIIYAGFLWMTAQGESDKVDQAKKMISQAVVGLIIIMAAYAIANFAIDAVLQGTGVAS